MLGQCNMLPLVGILMSIARNGGRLVRQHKAAAIYAFFFMILFTLVYWVMGMEKHFDVPDYIEKKKRNGITTAMYVSALAQSNAMPDMAPKTTLARMLFMFQVCTGWFWFLLFNSS